jgi:putative oxidoreductase
MSFGETIAPFLGRMMLGWFFLTQAGRYASDWNGTLDALRGVPAAPVVVIIALICGVLGALSLLIGFRTRLGALVLFTLTVIVSVVMHNYWTIDNVAARQAEYEIFARNIAIAGGLLFMVGVGAGRFAVEHLKSPGKR